MFISLQAGQNFPPAGQISLQCRMVSFMYFFIFFLQITKFPSKELPVLPVFSTPGSKFSRFMKKEYLQIWKDTCQISHLIYRLEHTLRLNIRILSQTTFYTTKFYEWCKFAFFAEISINQSINQNLFPHHIITYN